MAGVSELIEGLEIIAKYDPSAELSTGHECIYAGGNFTMTDEDAGSMEDLNWLWDEQYECWMRFV